MDILNLTQAAPTEVSIQSFLSVCTPLIFYMLGVVLYALFVFRFYKWLARKDVLGLHLHKRHAGEGIISRILKIMMYTLENLILIPIFILIWSAVLAAFIIVLSKGLTTQQILLSSVALVACVRVAAYYSRNLAEDLGKMIPFTLLALFIFDTRSLAFGQSLEMLDELTGMWLIGLYYLLFVVILEFTMRIIHSLANHDEDPETPG
jgi:hypothetical protein